MVQDDMGWLYRVDLPLKRYADILYERIYPLYNKEQRIHTKGWLLEHARELDCYKWCEENCEGEFRFTIRSDSDIQLWLEVFYFEFTDRTDAASFKVIFS